MTRAIDLRLELDPMIVQLLTKSVSSTYSIKRAIQDILFDNDFRVGISVRNCSYYRNSPRALLRPRNSTRPIMDERIVTQAKALTQLKIGKGAIRCSLTVYVLGY